VTQKHLKTFVYGSGLGAALLVAALHPASAQQRAPDEFTISVQGWTGGPFGREDPRQFSHCGVSRGFPNGVTVAFQMNASFQTTLGLRSENWELEQDDGSVVRLSVDDDFQRQFPVVAAAPQVAVIPLGTEPEVIDALRLGRELTITFSDWQSFQAGDTLNFPLTGTSASLRQLRQCVETANRLIAADPEAMGEGEGEAAPTPADRMMTIEGLASLLNAAGFENVELLDPEAVPQNALELRFVWRVDGITGALHQEPRGRDIAIDAFATRYLDLLAATCAGGFEPEVGETETIAGVWALKRATAECEAEDGTNFISLFFALDDFNYSVFYHLAPADRREDVIAATDRVADLVSGLARDAVAQAGAGAGAAEGGADAEEAAPTDTDAAEGEDGGQGAEDEPAPAPEAADTEEPADSPAP